MRGISLWLCVWALCLCSFAASRRLHRDSGALLADHGDQKSAEFTQAVFERSNSKLQDQSQDRLWRTPGNPDGTGGSTIVLSNINQLEAAQGKLKDHTEEAAKQRQKEEKRQQAERANKAAHKENSQKKMARLDEHARQKLKQQEHDAERAACKEPQLKNLYYTFQARNDPHTYLQHQMGKAVVDKTRRPGDKDRASFLVSPGLADSGYVSLRSLDKPSHFLRHKHWQLRLDRSKGETEFKNEATFRLVKGLAGCREGYVSFETNVKGKFLLNHNGQILVASVTEETKKFASFRAVPAIGLLYHEFWKKPGFPTKGHRLSLGPALPQPKTRAHSWMFWVCPTGKRRHWGNLFFKGTTNRQRNPAVWLYPGRTRLHIRSGSTSSWNSGMDPSADLPLNTWTHVAFIHRFGSVKVYYNGKLAGKLAIGAPLFNNGPLYSSDPWHQPGTAKLAQLRYYSRIATTDEVLAANGKQPSRP